MLPRLAAIVSITTRVITFSCFPIMRKISRVNGTKVISVTSLVMIILQKKHRSTSVTERLRQTSRPLQQIMSQLSKGAQPLKTEL